MSSYIVAGYAVTLLSLAGYALRVIVRGRRLTRALPPQERTWR